jgi:hypothetical protein
MRNSAAAPSNPAGRDFAEVVTSVATGPFGSHQLKILARLTLCDGKIVLANDICRSKGVLA